MPKENGLVQVSSRYSVDETVRRLQAAFAEKGLKVFSVVDHCGEAEKAGLKMRPTKVVIFGSPKAGTPLMVAAPSLAIDLLLKALVAEDAAGKVTVTHNSPEYLKERHWRPGGTDQESCGSRRGDRESCGIMLAAWGGRCGGERKCQSQSGARPSGE
jgi:uncharacterized protein (DUF302 family)